MLTKTRIEFQLKTDETILTIDYKDQDGVPKTATKSFPPETSIGQLCNRGYITANQFVNWEDDVQAKAEQGAAEIKPKLKAKKVADKSED
jgi:hypothetical protein